MNDKQLPNRARVKMFWDMGYDSIQIARMMKNSEANIYNAMAKILDDRYVDRMLNDKNHSRASA